MATKKPENQESSSGTQEPATAAQVGTEQPPRDYEELDVRLLVNPSGNVVAFPPRSSSQPDGVFDAYERHLYSQKPPNVKPEAWFRLPTPEEAERYHRTHQPRRK